MRNCIIFYWRILYGISYRTKRSIGIERTGTMSRNSCCIIGCCPQTNVAKFVIENSKWGVEMKTFFLEKPSVIKVENISNQLFNSEW